METMFFVALQVLLEKISLVVLYMEILSFLFSVKIKLPSRCVLLRILYRSSFTKAVSFFDLFCPWLCIMIFSTLTHVCVSAFQ